MSHDEKVEWLRQKFFSLKTAIHRTHAFDNNGNRLRSHSALGYQSIQSAMLCLNGAVSFRCGSGSAPLVRVTFPSRHDGFRFVLPGTAQIAAPRSEVSQCFATLLTSVSSASGAVALPDQWPSEQGPACSMKKVRFRNPPAPAQHPDGPSNAATQPRCEIRARAERCTVSREREADNIWQQMRDSDIPKKKKDSDPWRAGSPAIEALALFRLVGKNGDTAETLRELISVSDRELTELHEWAACSSPAVAVSIENMLKFRSKVSRVRPPGAIARCDSTAQTCGRGRERLIAS